jgi:hypothetical protein
LTAVQYLKDNRITPSGFDKSTANEDISVKGAAADDTDFDDGSDEITYRIPLAGSTGPFSVTAQLWYQPIGFRWAMNLGDYDTLESNRFSGYFEGMSDVSGVMLTADSKRVE